MEDKEIIELFFAREEAALEETGKKYGSILTHISENILRDAQEAQECYNDTLLSAWNQIPPAKPDNLLAYLAKCIRYISLGRVDYHLAAKRNAEIVELTQELENSGFVSGTMDAELEEGELSRLISTFLREKSYEKRVIFMRRYWYGDSIADIAKKMRITQGKAKSILFRIRNELKEYLIKEGVRI